LRLLSNCSPSPTERLVQQAARSPPAAAENTLRSRRQKTSWAMAPGGHTCEGLGMSLLTLTTAEVVTLCAGVLLLSGCGNGEICDTIEASGTIECTTINVASKWPGIVTSLTAQEGDHVDAGAEIATIDHSDLEWQLAQARARHALAGAHHDLAVNGPQAEDIAQAAATWAQARAQLTGARTDLVRVEELRAGGSATQRQLDNARTQADLAAAVLEQAQASLDKLRGGTRPEQVAAARAAVQQAGAAAASIEQRIRDCTVRAPTSGTITHRLMEPGEMAAAGSGLVTISVLESVWLKVYLSEIEVGRIKLGQEVRVFLDAAPETACVGKVIYISPAAEFTPRNVQTREDRVKLVFAVKVGLDNMDGSLKPGLPADAVFPDGSPVPGEG
jgi:HlyD family secretion protein